MLKTSERKRTTTICASLIASAMVTADCADEDCVCTSRQDCNDPKSAHSDEEPQSASATLPLEGKVIYRLEPVITSLPLERDIAIAVTPAEEDEPKLIVDSISQPDLGYAKEAKQATRRVASIQKRSPAARLPLRKMSSVASASETLTTAADSAAQASQPSQVPQQSKAPEPDMSTRPLLQDAYIAFGVNGR